MISTPDGRDVRDVEPVASTSNNQSGLSYAPVFVPDGRSQPSDGITIRHTRQAAPSGYLLEQHITDGMFDSFPVDFFGTRDLFPSAPSNHQDAAHASPAALNDIAISYQSLL